MQNDNQRAGDEMSDYIFKRYEECRDKCDALKKENERLHGVAPVQGETGMTGYQFKRYEELRDKCDELTRVLALFREENTTLSG